MKRTLMTLCVLGMSGVVSNMFAQETPDALRHRANELSKQKDVPKREINDLRSRAKMLEAAPKINDAIAKMVAVKPKAPRKVLVYSRTKGFRHKSIPVGILALTELGKQTGAFSVEATENPAVFTTENLARFDGIIMLNTTGDAIPSGAARAALETYLEGDKGLIGIHAATDCHGDWENYREAMGGLFDGHPWGAGHLVTLYNEEPGHPICKHIATGDQIKDEIYQYKDDKHFTRDKLRMLLSLDLSGENMKAGKMKRADHDYAVSWVRKYAGSRVFYSNLGHNDFTYYNEMALQHYLNGIQFALGDLEADARPSAEVGNGTARPLPAGF
jgi:type 1 glutamine amidotransferase